MEEKPFILWDDLIIASLHPQTQAICLNPKKYKKEDRSKIRGTNHYETLKLQKEEGQPEKEGQGDEVKDKDLKEKL